MKRAILFGASGLVGSCLLTQLLENPDYSQITVVVRKPLGIENAKLKTLIGDADRLVQLRAQLVADDVFLAIGTTKKQVPDEKRYYQIDHDYPLLAARLCRDNGASAVFAITAIGASADARFFYPRLKGELERDLIALDFKHTHIFRPSMILGNRIEHRALEKPLVTIWSKLNPLLIGALSPYRGIDATQLARAMVRAAHFASPKLKIYQWREMTTLADSI